MKIFLWIYAIVGTMYLVMYSTGFEPVVKYAVGPLWLLMMAAPAVIALLVILPFLKRWLPSLR